MKFLSKIITIVLCLSLCASLSACTVKQSDPYESELYLDGVRQGQQDFFMTIWESAYDYNGKMSGETWKTDDFAIDIVEFRKTEVSSDPNARYISIDFTFYPGKIEQYWNSGNLRIGIYSDCSVCSNGFSEIGDFDYFISYFDMGGILKDHYAHTDILSIHEDTEQLRVVIIVDDRIHATSYYV